jgi:hypothetical protein
MKGEEVGNFMKRNAEARRSQRGAGSRGWWVHREIRKRREDEERGIRKAGRQEE